jgi:Glycosyltransferase 61
MYFRPFWQKTISLLGLENKRLEDVCVKQWEIAPATQQDVPPSIHNAEDLDRITGSGEATTLATELGQFHSSVLCHAPTTGFLLEHVDMVDGFLYGKRWKDRLLRVNAPILANKPGVRIPHGSLACTAQGNLWFGHWMADDLTLHLAAEQMGNPFIFDRAEYLHEAGYRQLLGIPRSAVRRAHFDEIIIIRDFGQNDYKHKRYQELRTRLRACIPAPDAGRILLRRGTTGQSRSLVNPDEMERYLVAQGFSVVDPEQLAPVEIVKRMLGAEIVIGVEGSHLTHALYTMAEGGVLCCIEPPSRFVSLFRGYTARLDMRYAVVIGREVGGGAFRVDLDDLNRVLDKIEVAL